MFFLQYLRIYANTVIGVTEFKQCAFHLATKFCDKSTNVESLSEEKTKNRQFNAKWTCL